MSDYDYSEPMNQLGWFIKHKTPWPTLTGRQQFYIDHEWYLEVGEQLAMHKEPVAAGGPYPLRLNGGHNRWSQHSIMRANQQLLRLQRGSPVAYLSQPDARERGISDHDRIRVYNDVGEFTLWAKISPAVQPGEVICYHAWEGYQFPGGATQNDVAPNPMKPTNMVGGYGHLQYRSAYLSMNNIPKEVAVDVEKVREEEWERAEETVVPLEPTPIDRQPSAYVQVAWRDRSRSGIGEVRVRAVASASAFAVRLDWEALRPQRSISDVNVYPDACAVVFPADGRQAEFAEMGSPKHPVRAWHWRAGTDVPFVVTATGLGTVERVVEHQVQGRAAWVDGRWRVVLARPLDADGVPLKSGSSVPIAFAVWLGAARERAGLKSFSPQPCELRLG